MYHTNRMRPVIVNSNRPVIVNPNKTVIANQSADWCGNPLRVGGFFRTSWSGTLPQGIATSLRSSQ